jgi:hypothetical protein
MFCNLTPQITLSQFINIKMRMCLYHSWLHLSSNCKKDFWLKIIAKFHKYVSNGIVQQQFTRDQSVCSGRNDSCGSSEWIQKKEHDDFLSLLFSHWHKYEPLQWWPGMKETTRMEIPLPTNQAICLTPSQQTKVNIFCWVRSGFLCTLDRA